MPLNAHKYYNPMNKFSVSCDPINQAHTSGGAIQTNYIGNKAYVSGGGVSTRNVVIGYTITIRYDGPANIGDRVISQQQVPNYWSDPNVIAQAMGATGNSYANDKMERVIAGMLQQVDSSVAARLKYAEDQLKQQQHIQQQAAQQQQFQWNMQQQQRESAAAVAFSKALTAGPTGALVSFAVTEAANDRTKPATKPPERT